MVILTAIRYTLHYVAVYVIILVCEFVFTWTLFWSNIWYLGGLLRKYRSRHTERYSQDMHFPQIPPMIYYLLNYSKYHWEQLIKTIVQVYYIFHQFSVFNRMTFHFHNGTLMVFDDKIAPFPTKVRDTKLIHTVILYNEKIKFIFYLIRRNHILYICIYIHKSTRLNIIMG